MEVYIQDVASYMPNEPITNDQMEEVLGLVGSVPSRLRKKILSKNGIKYRYYAIDPKSGDISHSNAQLAAEAIRRLRPNNQPLDPGTIQCLSCGTATPDHVFPSHASMVHGELGGAPVEPVSMQGACLTGLSSIKYAFMNVALGWTDNAVASGSEVCSSFIRGKFYDSQTHRKPPNEKGDILPFEADFLRWMLSDGAGAVYLAPEPNQNGLSFKLEWVEAASFANELETCMYCGANKLEDGSVKGWRAYDSPEEALSSHSLAIKQDARLLNKEIVKTCVDRTLPYVFARHPLRPDEVTWFLPHYSSEFFRQEIYDYLKNFGFEITYDRWFTNLTTKGNTGSASIYIMLEDIYRSGHLKPGDRLLLFVPESARFAIGYALLTVV